MKVITHSIMYQANFAGGRSRLDLLLPSFLPSREEKKIQDQKNHPLGCRDVSHTPPKHLGRDEKKMQDRIFCPLRGHSVGRMRYAPTTCRQESMFQIILSAGKDEQRVGEGRRRHREIVAVWQDNFQRTRNEKPKMKALRTNPYRGPTTFQKRFPPLEYLKYPFCNACPSWANVETLMQSLAQLGQM